MTLTKAKDMSFIPHLDHLVYIISLLKVMSVSEISHMGNPIHNRKRCIIIPNSLNTKDSPIRKRIIEEYVPKYRKKLDL